jgi:5-methylcytosine-specific restriction endonuclease McrA
MSLKDREKYREYMREYQRKRSRERIALARKRLGGCCARCGATEDLDFDHIDRTAKVRQISEATNWSLDRFLAEVDKCQLLCKSCHRSKSIEAGDNGAVTHGGGARGKHNCKCDLCRIKNNQYSRDRKQRIRAEAAGRLF